jgi:hypothetical protein
MTDITDTTGDIRVSRVSGDSGDNPRARHDGDEITANMINGIIKIMGLGTRVMPSR